MNIIPPAALAAAVALMPASGVADSKSPVPPHAERWHALNESACADILKAIDALLPRSQTGCTASPDGPRKFAFNIISALPITTIASANDAWLVSVVGAVGYVAPIYGAQDLSELDVSDTVLAQHGKVLSMTVAKAIALRQRIAAGRISGGGSGIVSLVRGSFTKRETPARWLLLFYKDGDGPYEGRDDRE
jgi:hypothetical protein